jgi:hypothetical protein
MSKNVDLFNKWLTSTPEEIEAYMEAQSEKRDENCKIFLEEVELRRVVAFFHENKFCSIHKQQQMLIFDTIEYYNKKSKYTIVIDLYQCPICKRVEIFIVNAVIPGKEKEQEVE